MYTKNAVQWPIELDRKSVDVAESSFVQNIIFSLEISLENIRISSSNILLSLLKMFALLLIGS